MTKLTKKQIEEIKNNADGVYEYENVFEYKKNGKKTLVQNGKILVDDTDLVHWYAKDVFEYKKNGKYTLIQNNEILVKDADLVEWHARDVFEYSKNGKKYKIN